MEMNHKLKRSCQWAVIGGFRSVLFVTHVERWISKGAVIFLPLGISDNFLWGGYGFFLELHNSLPWLLRFKRHFYTFPTWPVPEGPVCITFLPMCCNILTACSYASSLPPTMNVNVPPLAAVTPGINQLNY